jgi:putative FmdB family regulatory protein
MPIYEYLCENCAVKFEKLVQLVGDGAQQPCPSCKEPVGQVPSVVSPTFIGDKTPQTVSGLSSLDNNLDRLVGEDSYNKWLIISEREKQKLSILNSNEGLTRADLRSDNGKYQVMGKSEATSFRENFRKFKFKSE